MSTYAPSRKLSLKSGLRRRYSLSLVLIYVFLAIIGLISIMPFLMMVGSSFAAEAEIRAEGYKIIPRQWSVAAYQNLLIFPEKLITGYKNTVMATLAGTFLHLVVCTLAGYALSVRSLKFRRVFQAYILLTMILNGGMVSWYIVCTRLLGLRNSYLSLIMPMVVSPFNIYLIRNYFAALPEELRESAMVDGAGQMRIFAQIILPLGAPVLATVALFISIAYWNDWYNSLMLNDKDQFYSLQLVLKSIISSIQFMTSNAAAAGYKDVLDNLPSETVKLATAVVTAGPIILIYPFVQKYFVKGITVGAVKG